MKPGRLAVIAAAGLFATARTRPRSRAVRGGGHDEEVDDVHSE
jgi:hypothetical protein